MRDIPTPIHLMLLLWHAHLQSGVAEPTWAFEQDAAASTAFKRRHPEATVACADGNVLLLVRTGGGCTQGTGLASIQEAA